PGRCRSGHEHRDTGRKRGRQHGGPGLKPDQADRDCRDRQATVDDARRAHNIMHLRTPESAILSAVIFNGLIIVALIPLALRGVSYKALGASALLKRN